MNDTIKNALDTMSFDELTDLAEDISIRQTEMLEAPMRKAAMKVMSALAELQNEIAQANHMAKYMGRGGYSIDFLLHNDNVIYIDEIKSMALANVDDDRYLDGAIYDFEEQF